MHPQDWITTLVTLSPESVTYLDFVGEGRRLALSLKVSTAAACMVPTRHLEQQTLNTAAGGSSQHSGAWVPLPPGACCYVATGILAQH